LRRPSVAALFTPELRRTTIVTTIMFAFAYGAAFGAIQQMPRIVPGLPEVSVLPGPQQQQTASLVQAFQDGLFIVPLVFAYAGTTNLELAKWGMFFAGLFTVAQFSFWGNYLPRVFPTHLRGTGEGFAANIGGRMLGTGFAFVTTQLANITPGDTPPARLAYAAAIVGFGVYLGGYIASWWLPEPKGEALPE
jgi:hypothetical protein